MSKKPRFPPKPRTVLVVVFPGFQLLDAAGLIAAFEIASRFVKDAYSLRVGSRDAGLVPSSSGVAMPAETLSGQRGVDTLVVVGGGGTGEAMQDAKFIAAIRRMAPRVRRVSS